MSPFYFQRYNLLFLYLKGILYKVTVVIYWLIYKKLGSAEKYKHFDFINKKDVF